MFFSEAIAVVIAMLGIVNTMVMVVEELREESDPSV
jgi:hypothetical protein